MMSDTPQGFAAPVRRALIEPILPTIVDGDHGLRIVLPGDGSYDALTSKRLD